MSTHQAQLELEEVFQNFILFFEEACDVIEGNSEETSKLFEHLSSVITPVHTGSAIATRSKAEGGTFISSNAVCNKRRKTHGTANMHYL